MTRDEVADQIHGIIRETFDLDPDFPIDDDTTAMDIDGWDSLAHTTLLLMIERQMSTKIDRDIEFDDVGALIDNVHASVG
mgnify:CR=1 FL=1